MNHLSCDDTKNILDPKNLLKINYREISNWVEVNFTDKKTKEPMMKDQIE